MNSIEIKLHCRLLLIPQKQVVINKYLSPFHSLPMLQLNDQLMPNLSVTEPNRSAKNSFCRGWVTLPSLARALKRRQVSSSLLVRIPIVMRFTVSCVGVVGFRLSVPKRFMLFIRGNEMCIIFSLSDSVSGVSVGMSL